MICPDNLLQPLPAFHSHFFKFAMKIRSSHICGSSFHICWSGFNICGSGNPRGFRRETYVGAVLTYVGVIFPYVGATPTYVGTTETEVVAPDNPWESEGL